MASGANKRPSQADKIIAYLKTHKCITAKSAVKDLSIYRLSARIFKIKERGYKVKSYFEESEAYGEKVRFKCYELM